MCIKTNKQKGLTIIKLKGKIYPEEAVDAAIEKAGKKFEIKKQHKKENYIITLKGSKKTNLELLGYEFANYLLYFSKHL